MAAPKSDGTRYRWLRAMFNGHKWADMPSFLERMRPPDDKYVDPADLDLVIDLAISKAEGK